VRPRVLHVAQIDLSPESGMGRVAWHWREAFEERGYDFIHIGPAETGRPVHPALFPWAAWQCFRRLRIRPAVVLVHEPAGLPFVLARHRSTIVFSHGLERRGWEVALRMTAAGGVPIRLRSRLLFPLWRLGQADLALRWARAVLVLNNDDLACVRSRYRRSPEDVHVFQNGVHLQAPQAAGHPPAGNPQAVLFIGTWMPRKGVRTLIEAAGLLRRQGIAPRFILAGTGLDAPEVLRDWPEELRPSLSVIPRFTPAEEISLYSLADVFVLPSFFEGQPLALLQAMAAGCCCIASEIGGSRDLIRHRETGLLHPAGDAERLAACIAESLADPQLRSDLGRNARLAVAQRTWEAAARDVVDFVERALGISGFRPEGDLQP